MLKLFNYKFIKVDEVGVLRVPSSVFLKSLERIGLSSKIWNESIQRNIVKRVYYLFCSSLVSSFK